MATANWRPDIAVQVAFNANPNDPAATPSWTDLTAVFRAAAGVTRGRQYELDQNQAAAPSLVFLDQNEALNPANPISPYAPNVVPYRQVLFQAMWPNGGVGNLLNTGYGTNPQLNTIAGYDPSFESYTAGATVPWILTTGGVSPVVSTSNPGQGTQDLQYTVTNAGTEQGVGLVIPCIPGRQYTSSVYVRQTGGNTTEIFINGGVAGTSSTATGAYVRLTVTWTATQPTHQLWVASFTTSIAGTVNVDAIQHEEGSSASTFTTSGPVIYGVFRGYVERWPSRWDHMGVLGRAEITCVDSFGPLNLIPLDTEYHNALLAKKPDYYWRLNEPQGATSFAETSGNSGPPLVETSGKYGAADTFAPGTATNIPGDPNGTGILTNSSAAGFLNIPCTVAQTGMPGTAGIVMGSTTAPFGYTVAAWISRGTNANDLGRILLLLSDPGAQLAFINNTWFAAWELSAPNVEFFYSHGEINVTDVYADQKPHLYVMTVSVTSINATAVVYMDGTQVATNTSTLFPSTNYVATVAEIGGGINPGYGQTAPGPLNGTYSHFALWNRVLSAGEVTDLWNAGKGYPGETSGARVARYLGYGWTGLTSLDTGQSVMGVSNLANNTALLAACQGVTTTENGNFWQDADGNTTFAARTRRYLATTSMYTFGENAAGGEYPYEGTIAFDFDPTLVYNNVEVDNYQGVTAVTTNAASQLAYYPRAYQRNINVQSQYEAIDASTYLLNQHAQPHLRVQQITLDPVGNPNLWPVVLSLEVGQRVTVKRRASAANSGAGLTIQADFFVEQISHDQIDMDANTWTTTLYLSPVDINQVGILDNATYGLLGTDGAALHSSITSAATSATVDSTGGGCLFSTTTPYPITIDQEIVTVTAVANAAADAFGRTVSNGWGTADIGGAWTATGGSASDYSVASSLGKHTLTSVNVQRETTLPLTGLTYGEGVFTVQVSALATGAEIAAAQEFRRVDASNMYRFEVAFGTSSALTLRIVKVVAGTPTTLASGAAYATATYAAATAINVRWRAIGTTLRLRAWVGATEPRGQWQVVVTDSTFTTGGVGFRSIAATGNTNASPVVSYGGFALLNPQTMTITRPTDGTAAAHTTGAPVQTYQPFILAY